MDSPGDSARCALDGQHVVVVGGSSGMGLGVARHAATAGARVTIMSRDRDRLDWALAKVPGGAVRFIDLRDAATVVAACADLGRVDHLVNSAGTFAAETIAESEPEAWRAVMEERLIGPLLMIKTLGSRLTTSVVLFSGLASLRPLPGRVVLTAALGAVEKAVRALALELAPVRINAIAPGMIDTPLLQDAWGDRREEAMAASAARLPVGRIGTPDDIASAAMFLMTNPFVTATTIEVDGGGRIV